MPMLHRRSAGRLVYFVYPAVVVALCVGIILQVPLQAQTDPGPRGGAAGAGGTFAVLDNTSPTKNANDKAFFADAKLRFQEVDSVSGTAGENGNGLGPGFNQIGCAVCHAQPAVGGSSPKANPQVVNNFAHLHGASNPADTSGFLSANGPIREVRFVKNADGSLDGGVHQIFSIAGRTDAPGCNLAQPPFAQQIAAHNAIFRIPTPVFGAGLMENTSDETLRASLDSTASQRAAVGIGGRFNTNGNDGTVTRFGWKAQNKSLLLFAGEAYNVEQGVSNEIFQNERFLEDPSDATVAACTFNGTPEDATNITTSAGSNTGTASQMSSDLVNFAGFMRLLAPPTPTTATASERNGLALFRAIGCALCHTETLVTEQKNGHQIGGGSDGPFPALSGIAYHPFSDIAIHHMGSGLADGVNQGAAGGDEFRTAPLWGVGQRVFFLHDGRTNDLVQAILAHDSPGSEADVVIDRFVNNLSTSQKQDVINFLRSL